MEVVEFRCKLNPSSERKCELTRKPCSEEEFCMFCLMHNNPFVKTSSCRHAKSFLQHYNFPTKIEYNTVICYLCHSLLKKIDNFKQKAEESFSLLQKQFTENKQHSVYLQNSSINISYIDSNTLHWNYLNQEPTPEIYNKTELPEEEIKYLNIKIESDSDNDIDLNTPLSEIKKENKRNRKEKYTNKKIKCKRKKKINKEVNQRQQKYDGKILVVHLDKEGILVERLEESIRESYRNMAFKCEHCIVGFDRESTWKDHMEKRHTKKKGSHVCDICASVLSTTRSYNQHVSRHTKRYECGACGTRYNTLEGAAAHYDITHEKILDNFSCHLCGYTAESSRKIRYHYEKHRQTDKPRCDQCGNTFVNESTLRKHVDTKHSASRRQYPCAHCHKVYSSASGLRSHGSLAHRAAPATAYCSKCNAYFRCAATLKSHLATHSRHVSESDKKFVCNECGNKYMKKYLLEQHINYVHLNKRDHVCKICSKAYRNASSLNCHYRFVHEKKRPARDKICDYCGRAFYSLSVLACHVRAHTGERPHACTLCRATFAHPGALYTHNKLVHANRDNK